MRRRNMASLALLTGLALTLTACSPASIGLIGILRQEDGSLRLLVHLCSDSVSGFYLRAISPSPIPAELPQNDSWRPPDQSAGVDMKVTGTTDVPMPFDENALHGNLYYTVIASGPAGNAESGSFTASDLAGVKPGKVLSWPRTDDSRHIVSPSEFEKLAEAYCRKPH